MATWIGYAGLRRQASIPVHPSQWTPVALFLLMRGSGLYSGMTECRREEGRTLVVRQGQNFRKEKRGNVAVQSAPALLFGSYDERLGWGAVFPCDVDAGRKAAVEGRSQRQRPPKQGAPLGGEHLQRINKKLTRQ